MHTAVPSAGDSDPEPLQIDIGIKEVAALTTEEKLQHFIEVAETINDLIQDKSIFSLTVADENKKITK